MTVRTLHRDDPALTEKVSPTPPGAEEAGTPRNTSSSRNGVSVAVVVGVAVAVAVAVGYGIALRLWLLFHLPLFGDEAVAGLMARQINSGHLSVFYWGQSYGGVEPYLAALLQRLGGSSPLALNVTATVLSAAAAVLVGAIVSVAGANRRVAVLAGAAAWVFPYVIVWNSVRELGFRYATLCFGLTALLCCARAQRQRARLVTFAVLGLAVGLGWWASPEVLYFALPCLILLVGWWRRAEVPPMRTRTRILESKAGLVAIAIVGALIGSAPWWYSNLRSGFASLKKSSFPAGGHVDYVGRLGVFFHDTLPMELGVRSVPGGAWTGGTVVGVFVLVVLLAIVVLSVIRAVMLVRLQPTNLVPIALAVGVVTYPFLMAAVSATSYWVDGRYGLYESFMIVPLVAVTLPTWTLRTEGRRGAHVAPTDTTHDRERSRDVRVAVAGLIVLAVTALTVGTAHAGSVPTAPDRFVQGWSNPNAAMTNVVDAMRAQHISDAFASYWTAYDLELVGDGKVTVSPSVVDVDRWPALQEQVKASSDPAWLFFAPSQVAAATNLFSNPEPGPGGDTEQAFEAQLRQQSIPYRVVHLGPLDAVVPDRKLIEP